MRALAPEGKFHQGGTERCVPESTEERMKSVDRDLDSSRYRRINVPLAYFIAVVGAYSLFLSLWKSNPAVIEIISLPLLYIAPLTSYYWFRRYIGSARKENLISERVSENCKFLIGNLILFVYLAFMIFFTFTSFRFNGAVY